MTHGYNKLTGSVLAHKGMLFVKVGYLSLAVVSIHNNKMPSSFLLLQR